MFARLKYAERPLGENQFVLPPITTQVDPNLLALPDHTNVGVFCRHWSCFEYQGTSAEEAVATWRDTIARQARGEYWAGEIAASLAEENGLDADALLDRMEADHKAGTLVLRDRDTLAPVVPNMPFKAYRYFMYPADIDAMLVRWGVPYRFSNVLRAETKSINAVARKPVQRMPANEEAILAALKNAGYDPMAIPRANGTNSPAKNAARAGAGLAPGAFKHAWSALRKPGGGVQDAT